MTQFKNTLTVLFIFTISIVNAQWTSLTKENGIKQTPKVTVVSDTETSTVIDIELSGFDMNYEIVDGVDYHVLDLLTDSNTNIVGAPSLPIIPNLIAVPDNASVSVEIVKMGEITTYENINILPGLKSRSEGEEQAPYNKNLSLYGVNEMYPSELAKIDSPVIFRDYRIVRLGVSPMQYNPVTKQLQVVSSFRVRLNYVDDGNAINPRTTGRKAISPSFDKLYKTSILNYENNNKSINDTHITNDLMLCIVPDALYNDFLPYADWKKRTGVDIHITKFSDIGATSANPITIRDHVSDAYNNWATPPSYVLLVGDYGVFPTKDFSSDGWTFAWENFFVEVDGSDYVPDMLIGRFTNQGSYRLRVLTSKFEKYIRDPYVAETAWYKKGLFASNSAYQSQVNTVAWTRDILLNHAGFTSVDPMMYNGEFDGAGNWNGVCDYDEDDVVANLNQGRSVVNYRGEGWHSGWTLANCMHFQSSNLPNLNPSRKNFFFTNIGCGVAMFDSGSESFGEKLVEQGTISNPKGAIAFIGPTSNTHTTYNNKMDKGIHKGMYQEGLDTPGEALARGRIYQMAVFGVNDDYNGTATPGTPNMVEYHHRVFCVLGDPSIQIWKEIPLAINATHVATLPVGNNDVTIAVNYQATNLPNENARVTLTNNNGLFITGTTDASGNVTFNIDVDNLGVINVTVVGEDVITYEGVINMTTAGINDVVNDLASFNSQPNPFTSSTKINYTLLESNNTSIRIFNVRGQVVRNLQSNMQSAGNHTIEWNGLNDNGNKLNGGVYFCQLVSGNNVSTIKLLMNE